MSINIGADMARQKFELAAVQNPITIFLPWETLSFESWRNGPSIIRSLWKHLIS